MKLLVSAAAVAVAVALVVGSCCTSTSTASPSPSFSPSFPRTNIAYSPITRPSFGQPLNLTLSSGGWGTEDEDSLVESLLQLGNNNRRGSALPHEIAFEFAANHLLLPRNSFSSESSTDPALLRQLLALHSSYTTAHNNLTHIHLQQTLDGVPIANAVANININSETGEIVSFGSSLFPINEVVMVRLKSGMDIGWIMDIGWMDGWMGD